MPWYVLESKSITTTTIVTTTTRIGMDLAFISAFGLGMKEIIIIGEEATTTIMADIIFTMAITIIMIMGMAAVAAGTTAAAIINDALL